MDDHLRRLDTLPAQIAAFESSQQRSAVGYGALPALLPSLVEDFLGVRSLLELPLTDDQRRRCYRTLARLAGLIAPALFVHGRYDEGMGWYGTARDAGERADDRSVMSWSRATVSRMSLFTGHPARALREARQTLAHGGAGAAVTLWAWDVEAQSLAALGR